MRHPFSLHFTKHGSTSPHRQRLFGWRAPCERSSCTYLQRTQPTVAAGGKLPESCIETTRERRLQKREKSSHFHSQCPKKSCPSWPSVKSGSPSTTRWSHTGHGSFLCHRGMENLGRSRKTRETISHANEVTRRKKKSRKLNLSLNLSFSYLQHMLHEIISSVRSGLVTTKQLIDISPGKWYLETERNGAAGILTELGRTGDLMGPSRGERQR